MVSRWGHFYSGPGRVWFPRKNGPGAEAGSARAGAVPLGALSERRIYTIGETRAGPAYFVIPGTLAG
jgi:hypothetical protein